MKHFPLPMPRTPFPNPELAKLLRLILVRSVKLLSYFVVLAVPCLVTSCDDDDIWAGKPHVTSPSGWCVAFVQENSSPSPSGWSAVLLDFRNSHFRQCCHTAVEFRRAGVPLKMRWLDPTTLEIRYPQDTPLYWPGEVSEHVAECVGRRVRVVLVKI